MKVGKRGKDLAIRLPKRLVEKFDLKVGDMLDSSIIERALLLSRHTDRQRSAPKGE
ncbi:MAG: hypothetical protein QM676_12230 [Novosphingobium sp.]